MRRDNRITNKDLDINKQKLCQIKIFGQIYPELVELAQKFNGLNGIRRDKWEDPIVLLNRISRGDKIKL